MSQFLIQRELSVPVAVLNSEHEGSARLEIFMMVIHVMVFWVMTL